MHFDKTIVIVCGCFVMAGSAYALTRVRVTEIGGAGLADVRVSSETDYGKTDQDGFFSLNGQAQVVRFSKDGFRPVTKFAEDIARNAEVRLARDPTGSWKPPRCSASGNRSVISGWNMRFLLPRGLRVRRLKDIDYSMNIVCRGRECLRHGWGPLWGSGMPPFPEKFLASSREIVERDLYNYQAPDFPGIEYRGVRADGTYFPSVGIFGETIDYDQASKESARMFDALIDSLCWIERKP